MSCASEGEQTGKDRDWRFGHDLQRPGFDTAGFERLQAAAAGYGLTTAQILYRRPDHQWLLQTYVWQNYDLFPKFPELQRFLAFWVEKLEGPLHSVMVAHSRLIKPAELKAIDGEFRLN